MVSWIAMSQKYPLPAIHKPSGQKKYPAAAYL